MSSIVVIYQSKYGATKKDPATYEPWEVALIQAVGSKCDWTNKKYIEQILEYVRIQ